MGKLSDELPETETGLRQYISYANAQIKENKLNTQRLNRLIETCYERLEKMKPDENNC